jgi:osmotically inducible protein OsmC
MIALTDAPASLLMPCQGEQFLPLYTTTVAVSAGGAPRTRASGRAVSDDGHLDLVLTQPRELGGDGCGTNAQQLFAAGFASCFQGAMDIVAASRRLRLPLRVDIAATVSFSRDPVDGLFVIAAALEVSLPAMDTSEAARLVAEAERICPFARTARTGMRATVRLV